jgi:hypothetical protein
MIHIITILVKDVIINSISTNTLKIGVSEK